MATRFKTQSKKNYGISPLKSGYEKDYGTSELYINPCGLEDVDVAMFNLFDKEIVPTVGEADSRFEKVPVIFAAGEKWAMLKKGRPVRDQVGSLILPLITIMRNEIVQDISNDVTKRGINQQTGEMVVKRRIDRTDRDYQALINRLFLRNQTNLAVNESDERVDNQLVVERKLGDLSQDKDIRNGALLKPVLLNNIFETIVVPTPQFYTVKYQVTIWTQYMQHSNQILEKIVSSFLPQSQAWKLDTDKGYWFVGTVEGGAFNMESSFEDMSTVERFIKHSFVVTVPAYFFATQTAGGPIPIKRYVSSPVIEFKNFGSEDDLLTNPVQQNKYILGSDDPTLPLDEQKNVLVDQRDVGWRHQKISPLVVKHDPTDPLSGSPNDPAKTNSPRGYRYIKSKTRNVKGETVHTGYSLDDLE